nr:substrate-binding domain-containing protein [Burkholderia ubonensis]
MQGRAYLDQIAGTISEGILVTNANLHLPDLVDVARRGVPVVLCLWERPDAPPEGLPCVGVNFREAGRIATRHLLELGHKTIGVIVGGSASGVQAARYDGFVDVMREAGLDQRPARDRRAARGGRIDDAARVRTASLPRLVVRGTTAPAGERATRRAARSRLD